MLLADTVVVGAFIGGFATIIAAFIAAAYTARRGRSQVQELRADLRTNHGQKPGEYIEQTALAVFRLEDWSRQHTEEDADFRAEMRLWRATVEPKLQGGKSGAARPSDTAADAAVARRGQVAGEPE